VVVVAFAFRHGLMMGPGRSFVKHINTCAIDGLNFAGDVGEIACCDESLRSRLGYGNDSGCGSRSCIDGM
jgi:hypothetical protein